MADFVLAGQFKFVPERQEYIGVVGKVERHKLTIVSVGAESTEMAILEWLRETIRIMREAGRTDVQAPDMYDRANAAGFN